MSEAVKKPLQSPNYVLSVTFDDVGITVNDGSETETAVTAVPIKYTEVCNFIKSRFPARVLSITLSGDQLNTILAHREKYTQDEKRMFKLTISANIASDASDTNRLSYEIPVKLGTFLGEIKDNSPGRNTFTEANELDPVHGNKETYKSVDIILWREEELGFGLNANINFLMTKSSLTSLLTYGLSISNPNLKLVIGKLDHNPIIDRFLVPRMDTTDFIEFLEMEFGFYKTKHTYFVQDDILYFLGTGNDLGVSVPDLESNIYVETVHNHYDPINSGSVKSEDKKTTSFMIMAANIKYDIVNDGTFKNDPIRISANGNMSFETNSSARNVDTVMKITEVPSIKKHNNVVYETVTLSSKTPISKLNPLAKISIKNNLGVMNTYRLSSYRYIINSKKNIDLTISAFRVQNNI